jgi:hypothetical protein
MNLKNIINEELNKLLNLNESLSIDISKNTSPAPNMGSRFGQDVEPNGTYVVKGNVNQNGWINGKANLKNPLLINVDDNTLIQYKYDLAKKYKAKGKNLSNKLMQIGHDAIITVYPNGEYGEIVLLPNASFILANPKSNNPKNDLNEQQMFDNIWYHGGKVKINSFLKMPPINRRGNVEGFYFTKFLDVAKGHGDEITNVKLKIKNPFILGKSNVSKSMINTYAIELHKENDHLPLDGSWIKEKCQYFVDKKYMPYTGLDGFAQQLIYKSGGFDSVLDGHEICVFNNDDIIILPSIDV